MGWKEKKKEGHQMLLVPVLKSILKIASGPATRLLGNSTKVYRYEN